MAAQTFHRGCSTRYSLEPPRREVRRLPRLPATTGIHHAVHAGAEWPRRALLSKSEGGMRLAAQLQLLRRSSLPPDAMDWLVQHRPSPSSAGLPKSYGVPKRSITCGL